MGQSDEELLREFVTHESSAAFGEIVDRYTDLVYASARRQVGDSHLAEDVTQAVFIILARKARSFRPGTVLSGWLVYTARYAALNARKRQTCALKYERRAASMRPDEIKESESLEEIDRLGEHLDEALAALPSKDRDLLALRYLQQKSFEEVSAAVGIGEHAAKKRVSRALEKLRHVFLRKGFYPAKGQWVGAVPISAAAFSELMAATKMRAAPVGLKASIARDALAAAHQTTAAGASAVIAKEAIQMIAWIKIRMAMAVFAGFLAALGSGIFLTQRVMGQDHGQATVQSPALAANPPAVAAPPADEVLDAEIIKVQNTRFKPAGDFDAGMYEFNTDPNERRTPSSPPSGHIKTLKPKMVNPFTNRGAVTFKQSQVIPNSLQGKRVRMTGWVKTKGIENWAGLQFGMFTAKNAIAAYDMMGDRPIHGTTDWTQYSLVEDVPMKLSAVTATAAIYDGAGELWFTDVQFQEVSKTVPTTDDTLWHQNGPRAQLLTTDVDPDVMRNGHPTTRLSSAQPAITQGLANTYTQVDRRPDQYLGKRVRFSVWIKSEGVLFKFTPFISARGATDKQMAQMDRRTPDHLDGNMDWTLCTAEANVPAKAMNIAMGIAVVGQGKLWVDDFKMEVIPNVVNKNDNPDNP